MKWETKDGQIIDMKDMSDNHLNNCIKMIERQLRDKPDNYVYMGDSYYAEQSVELENEHNIRLEKKLNHIHNKLQEEREMRNK